MISITINDKVYNIKQNLKEITVKEYFDIITIMNEKLEKKSNIVVSMGKLEKKQYYSAKDEPKEFKESKRYRILNILSKIPIELFEKVRKPLYEDSLADIVEGFVEGINDDTPASKEFVIDGIKYVLDDIDDWTFQQWVDVEGTIERGAYYPFVISVRECNDKRKKYIYDRKHGGKFAEKLKFWMNKPAFGIVNNIIDLIIKCDKLRNKYPYIYNAKSSFSKPLGKQSKQYYDYAKWEDVVISIASTNAFNSDKGTLVGVRNANLIDVLEYLNFTRGKSFAENEDYQIEQAHNDRKRK